MRSTRVVLAVVVGALLCSGPVNSAPGGCTNVDWLVPFAFETITVGATAIGFTAATFAPSGQKVADMAVATIEDDAIRYRADGVNPTAAIGHLAAVDTTFTACGEQSLRTARFIRVTGDASVSVSYYRMGNQ